MVVISLLGYIITIPGTSICGVPVGGMTVAAAAAYLEETLDWNAQVVTLLGNGKRIDASLVRDIGMVPDFRASIEKCRRPLWLAFRHDYPLYVHTDPQVLSSFATKLSQLLDRQVVDARLSLAGGDRVVIIPETRGWSLDSSSFQAMLSGNDPLAEIPVSIDLPYDEIPPAVLASELELYMPMEKIAVFSTQYADNNDRAHNISLACAGLTEVIIGPGQVFSFNQVVGPRSMERGYRKAPVFVGDETLDDYGGGVCQISTTLYVAMLKAGFEATERYCHAKPVTYVPMGLDATVAYGYLDLRMTNPGDAPCLVRATAKGGKLTAEVFGMPLPDLRIEVESKVLKEFPAEAAVLEPAAEGAVVPKLRSGFLVETVRKWVRGGLLERVERLDTSMYPAEKPKSR